MTVTRRGGLLAMPSGVMTPVFALLVAFLALDVALIVAPFFVLRDTDHAFGTAERMEFLAKAMASALAFGVVAAITAERRNYTPWAFLLGHAGFPLAIVFALLDYDLARPLAAPLIVVGAGFLGCVAALLLTARMRAAPKPLGPVLSGICRVTGACGNIWFGIALMAAIAIAVGVGTIVESMYTARVAQHTIYRAPWFGAIFFVAGLSMLSATLRKWPFRLEQAGWLTVHSGLALVVIGSMMSFLTSVEGDVQIAEGQRVDSFRLSTGTRFRLVEQVPGKEKPVVDVLLDELARFEANPANREPDTTFESPRAPLRLTVDRFFGTGNPKEVWHDDGAEETPGVELDVFAGEARKPARLRLGPGEHASDEIMLAGMRIPVSFGRMLPRLHEAMTRREAADGHGRLVVRNRGGVAVAEIPVVVPEGAETRPEGAPAPLAGSTRIPGTDIQVTLHGYYDGGMATQNGGIYDASPGLPFHPIVTATLTGPAGDDQRSVAAYQDAPLPPPEELPAGRYPYEVVYEYAPRIDVPGPRLFLNSVANALHYVWVSRDGDRVTGPVVAGTPLGLPMPFVRIVPARVYQRLRIESLYEFGGYAPDSPVVRLTPSWRGEAGEAFWLPLGATRELRLEGRRFAVGWLPAYRPLGFTLGLYDFHRDFHPGSLQPATFESYLRLVHPAKYPAGEDIKIDMNHPLRLDGWRLYQSRFGGSPGGVEHTVLQVNRDPGLVIIYPACAIVLLGLIVVLFMKKTLALVRKKLEREGVSPARHVLVAVGAVAAVGIGPALFSAYVALRPWFERQFGVELPFSGWPAFAFGLSLTVLCPIMVVTWFTRFLPRRLAA